MIKTIIVEHKENQRKYKNSKVIRFNDNDIVVFNISLNEIHLTLDKSGYKIIEFDNDLSQDIDDDSYNYISTNINNFLNSKIYNTLYIKYLKELEFIMEI